MPSDKKEDNNDNATAEPIKDEPAVKKEDEDDDAAAAAEANKDDAKSEDKPEAKEDDGAKDSSKKVKAEASEETDDKKGVASKASGTKRGAPEPDAAEEENGSPVGKRRRKKSTSAYKPDDFTEKVKKDVVKGRGTKLLDISSTKESIKSFSVNSEEFHLSYRFIFLSRGKLPQTARGELLEFQGYLPEQDDDEDEAKREKADEVIETKYSKKAYKLTVPMLKLICDFFDVDRGADPGEKVDKDVLVDRLLDFLSAPSEEQTSTYVKEHNSERSSAKETKSESSEDEANSDGDDEDGGEEADDKEKNEEADDIEKKSEAELKGGKHKKKIDKKVPNDKVLRKWVRAYVACHNMRTATLRHAVEVASGKFGVDMKVKKESIKMFLTEEC